MNKEIHTGTMGNTATQCCGVNRPAAVYREMRKWVDAKQSEEPGPLGRGVRKSVAQMTEGQQRWVAIQAEATAELKAANRGLTQWIALLALSVALVVGLSATPDFCAGAGGGIVMPHVVWQLGPFLALFLATQSKDFGPDLGLQGLVIRTQVAAVTAVLGMLVVVTHLAFVVIELVQNSSDLVTNANSTVGFAFLILLAIVLGAQAILCLILSVMQVRYGAAIRGWTIAGWVPGYISSSTQAYKVLNATEAIRAVQPGGRRHRRKRKYRGVV